MLKIITLILMALSLSLPALAQSSMPEAPIAAPTSTEPVPEVQPLTEAPPTVEPVEPAPEANKPTEATPPAETIAPAVEPTAPPIQSAQPEPAASDALPKSADAPTGNKVFKRITLGLSIFCFVLFGLASLATRGSNAKLTPPTVTEAPFLPHSSNPEARDKSVSVEPDPDKSDQI